MYVFLYPGDSDSVHWDGTWEPIFLISYLVVWESLPFDAICRVKLLRANEMNIGLDARRQLIFFLFQHL